MAGSRNRNSCLAARGEQRPGSGGALEKTNQAHRIASLFSKVSDFLYIGGANRRFYENFGVSEEQLHPARYCVDNERFKSQAEELRPQRSALRQAWQIPEDSFCILFAGKFMPKKRPLDIIEAATRLRRLCGGKVHILFAGSGELGGALRQSCNVVFDAEFNGPLPKWHRHRVTLWMLHSRVF